MLSETIKFGTDGWRGLIGGDFTFDRAALACSAIRLYLEETGRADSPLLIGYDCRFAAENYAAHLASHLAAGGQEVVLSSSPCPTPALACAVKQLSAAGAIMLTASHNRYYWQGLKFIPYFAGPAMPESTDRITALIAELAPSFRPPALRLEYEGGRVDFKEAYFKQLDILINANSLSSTGWKVLYNPMHGTGAGHLDGYLIRAGVETVTINGERDVYFGGVQPDPSPGNIAALADKVTEEGCQVLIATDGDADRFGILDSEGRYFGANHALPLLADYLVRYRKLSGALVRNLATTHMLDDVATEHGLELVETRVGFKYIGEHLRRGALIGGEESGGMSVQGHVPDKDGILTALLMIELAATTGEDFHSLYKAMQDQFGPRAFDRTDIRLSEEEKASLFERLGQIEGGAFAGKGISSRNDTDGVKFVFDDGGWVMLRASGTEPLVRIYLEVTAAETLSKVRARVLDEVKAMVS
ncbi:phosphoglucomutase/phosphomannomutase family protein [bacterium]|nr:phosphoglucomutase/phosphomannomutase family protein [bacterium]